MSLRDAVLQIADEMEKDGKVYELREDRKLHPVASPVDGK